MKGLHSPFLLVVCLVLLMPSCKPSDSGTRDLQASRGGEGGSGGPGAEAPQGAPPPPAPGAPDEPASPTPDPPGDPGGRAFTPPPAGCEQPAKFSIDCWTAKFPPDISHLADVACRYTFTCCGSVVDRWERAYPQSAGPSGVVFHETRDTGFGCNSPMPLGLGDLDGDDIPNAEDPNPDGGEGLPWK